MGNQQSTVHEPNLTAEPPKPALSRSRSIKSDADAWVRKSSGDNVWHPKPSDEHNVKFSRTVPYDGSDPLGSGLHGGDSPQWGWYTHHSTPPTPELYYKRVAKKKGTSSSIDTAQTENSDTSNSAETQAVSIPHPNPVFKILQNKYKATPTAWNVP